jgi:myosin-5
VFSLQRRKYRKDVKKIILIQSCIRRRLAKKELKALRQEARSVSKFKEISYRLENKVVELTQALQTRTAERKELQGKVDDLEKQLRNWISKYEDSDSKARQLQADMQSSFVPLPRFEELMASKSDLDSRMEAAVKKAQEQEEAINSLTTDLEKKTKELEAKSKITSAAPAVNGKEDGSVIAALKTEVSTLREQLNRANALNSLTGRAYQPTSPTFAPNLKGQDKNTTPHLGPVPVGKRRQRRHSTAGVYADRDETGPDSDEDLMYSAKRSRDPRAVSMAFPQDGIPRFRPTNGLPDIYDDPAEEKIRLLEDAEALDEEILQILIKGLKIPTPNLTNQPSMKEVLFPANLISLVTNEMWKYGLIAESERFLANVMQTVQSHVMVSISFLFYVNYLPFA